MSGSVPAQFDNISVVTQANVYFGGKVVSHTVLFADGSKKTLGVILPGEYHFTTGVPERMDIIAGACRVRQAGEAAWTTYAAGSGFDVPGDSAFDIAVDADTAQYLCGYA